MILKRIEKEEISKYLDEINYIAYSDAFAKFAQSAYSSRRLFTGIFENEELKAFFPVFERKTNYQRILEVPTFIYLEIFFIDKDFIINGMELGPELLKLFDCDVARLNIYNLNFTENFNTDGFEKIFTAMIIPLEGIVSFEDYLMNRISKNARSKIYKGLNSGFEFVELKREDLPEFYQLYQGHIQHLNSIPHPINYFEKIIDSYNLGEDLYMFGARHGKKLVSANLFAMNKDYLEVKFLADDISERHLFPNNYLYAQMIKWAIEKGAKFIDFGGIPNNMRSNIEFKKSFGAKEYPLFTRYFFSSTFHRLLFNFNRRVLYIKKNPRLVFKKLIFGK